MNLIRGRLETLFEDGEFVLCRSSHPADTTLPSRSVLFVMPRSEHPRPQAVRMLEHEYSLRDQLDPVWAARPIALTTREGRVALVFDDPGGELLVQRLGTPMDVGEALRVGAGLAAALRQMHGRGLIHKDIKPANVLTDGRTGRVWVRGFGIASRLVRERRLPEPPEFIAGTLAYMAPEQTGWMNRSIDARSDLYALGVVLYEMLSGSLPFTASDPMTWVHSHLARRPVPPAERLYAIPEAVSAIVMKLLAKTAEDRYQTAAGVEHDVRRCLAQWEADGRVDGFPLAEHDTPDRLVIPERLYGRARAIDTLRAAFDRVVTSGMPELVLVSGFAGIGKSAVVHELHKALVPSRGLFAAGKFDQYKRDIPYATLAQAFQSLIRHFLAQSEAELDKWRAALREALEPNGRLMVDIVPELTLLIGDQPPVPELAPQNARRRFQVVFRRFIGVFARPDHPLALFLDDLQWLDAATLDLLEDLLTQADLRYVMLIGAYRDNEVTAAHPLMRKLEAIRNAGGRVQEVTLAPLAAGDVAQLIGDALRCGAERAAPLAHLVHEKAAGNPFFTIQFVSSLTDEGMLVFDHAAARWSWDLERIHAKGYTDNVVDLMIVKLHRLPIDTQQALQQLACLGHSAPITTLGLVFGTAEEEVHARLWEAVRHEVIERLESAYRFIHDRVQEAAYSLIPEERRAGAHLRIGRLLAAHIPLEEREEAIFELVNQLNRGAALITEPKEREQLAELNLMAGRRAKHATAYASALTYLLAGVALLAEDCWERQHAVAFALEFHRAECEFLTGTLAAAAERLTALATRAATTVEHATVSCLRMDVHTTLGQSSRAIAVGLDYLRRVGIDWSPHPTDEDVRREYEWIWAQLGGRTLEELIELPLMSDAIALATLDVLTRVFPPARQTDGNLFALVTCRAVNLSLERGNSDGSCFAYAMLGWVTGSRYGDYQAGLRFGQLGFDLIERRGLKRFQAITYLGLGSVVLPWTTHVRAGRELVRRAFEAANKIGDLTCAVYCCYQRNMYLLAAGDPLAETQREAENGLAFMQKMPFGFAFDVISAQLGLIRTLRGLTRTFGVLDDEQFDELRVERRFTDHPDWALGECEYWIRKLQARYLAGDAVAAVEAAAQVQRLLWTEPSPLEAADFHLYGALSHAACCDSAAADRRQHHVEALAAHHRQLAVWAENGPENFENRAALVGAEMAHLEGRELDAMRLYERAIESARANGFVHHEALAHELAGRFYLQRGFETAGSAHLRHARACYALWGADGKVRQLDELYPRLTQDDAALDSRATIGAPVEQLELATVLKVSQAVSSEIVLEQLVETVLRTAIEHAGAERGLLLLPRGSELLIRGEAETRGSSVTVRLCETSVSATELPESLVRYAARTHERVILDDASAQSSFSADGYIREQRPRSVMCLPLIKQGALVALLYLENKLASSVFTPARIGVLGVLASQAAISLENSRLYRELQGREAEIRRLVDSNIVGILMWDLEGRILEANDAFLQIVGYDREDLLSGRLRWTDLTPPEILERELEQLVPQVKLARSLKPWEKEYFHKDGHRVPVLIGVAPFDDESTRGVAFIIDLTERKRAEAAQKRAEVDLRQAQTALAHRQRVSMLGEVAASLAHEIRQPIAALTIDATACLRALTDARADLQEARRAASRIVKEATWADEIISRTSALYRKDTTLRDRVDVNAVIRDMAVLLQQEAAASSVSIRTELADGLPEVLADRVQLQQVFMNLMLNAIEAMKETGGGLTMTSAMGEPGELLISVSDMGVGLPTDTTTIFDAFVTTKPQGTGLGLAITRSIVDAHGGRLWARPNIGPGATFFFTLAADQAEMPQSQAR